MHIEVTLTYDGKDYRYIDPSGPWLRSVTPANVAYQYFEGNWSCDCNRFDFLNAYAPDFELSDEDYDAVTDDDGTFPCGDTITLKSLVVNGRPLTEADADASWTAP